VPQEPLPQEVVQLPLHVQADKPVQLPLLQPVYVPLVPLH
jgi:hypothetical protein